MTDLNRFKIEQYRQCVAEDAFEDALCDMALRTHDAEQRVQRAEAECERLRTLADHMKAALEFIAEEHDAGRHDGLPEPCPAHDEHVMWQTAHAALATPPPEGEPNLDEHPTNVSSMTRREYLESQGKTIDAPHTPEKAESYPLDSEGRCLKCGGTGRIGVDSTREPCPACTSLPSQQAHGDALADYRQIEDYADYGRQLFCSKVEFDRKCRNVRQALTASGVPEEVRRFPDLMRRLVREQKMSNETRDYIDALSHRLDAALASAPAVPGKYGEHSADVVADSNWSAGARFGWNCAIAGDKDRMEKAIQSRIDERAQIAAAPTDGREHE